MRTFPCLERRPPHAVGVNQELVGRGYPIGARNLKGPFSPPFTSRHQSFGGPPHGDPCTLNTSIIYSRPYTYVRLPIIRQMGPTGKRPWGTERLYVESDSGLYIRTRYWQREVPTLEPRLKSLAPSESHGSSPVIGHAPSSARHLERFGRHTTTCVSLVLGVFLFNTTIITITRPFVELGNDRVDRMWWKSLHSMIPRSSSSTLHPRTTPDGV